jgi:reactive intermediate/imine deaminase
MLQRYWALCASLFVVSLVGCQLETGGEGAEEAEEGVEVAYLMANPESGMPFSDAVRVDDFLFLSGQVGTDSTGTLVEGGITPETRQTLDNIRDLLEANGSSLDRVVKCTAMLADISEWQAMNEVYVTYFTSRRPARSAFGASGLALGARIELECWATMRPG